jgi:amino acid permease
VTGSAKDRKGPDEHDAPVAATRSGGGGAFGSFTVITDARGAVSQEQATRQRRYAITMAFRTACFIAMIFVPGALRWVLFAGAVFLPYIAVIFANQAHQRPPGDAVGGGGDPGDAPAITTGEERGQIISGEIITDDEEPDDRVA